MLTPPKSITDGCNARIAVAMRLALISSLMHSRLVTAFGLGLLVVSSTACQHDVEKDKMEGIATWMAAACACSQKPGATAASCKAANPEPEDIKALGDNGRPQYKPDSYDQYNQMRIRGEECIRKIAK